MDQLALLPSAARRPSESWCPSLIFFFPPPLLQSGAAGVSVITCVFFFFHGHRCLAREREKKGMPATMMLCPDLRRVPMSRSSFVRVTAPRSPRSVKRCLFEVDHDEVLRDLEVEKLAEERRFREKYNFDLRTETPLPGRYDWSTTDAESSDAAPPGRGKTKDAVASDATLESSSQIALATATLRQPCRQGNITDYFPSRKRRSTEKTASPVEMSKVLCVRPPEQQTGQ